MIAASSDPVETDIVLVGAGHAHVQVLRSFGMKPVAGLRLTLITDRLLAPYSGMLPGCIAGDYSADAIHIDVARLARATGTRLIHAAASGFERAKRQVLFADRAPVAYDLLSINVGITPDLSSIAGADRYGVPVKPIARILERLAAVESRIQQLDRPARLCVIGGGAAGIELALALLERSRRSAIAAPHITLIAGSGLAPGLNARMQRLARAALTRAGIFLVMHDRAVAIAQDNVLCQSGQRLATDAVFVSTNARLPQWLMDTDLPKAENGGIAIRQTLQLPDDDRVFAVGDCATMLADPRPRAGVFAVRQGPHLAANLRAVAAGRALAPYHPQHDYLSILRTGPGRAIAGRGRFLAVEGAWVWYLKDRIDRAFMAKFLVADADPAHESLAMRCGGCAAKVGPDPLQAALSRLPPGLANADIAVGLDAPDDAAIIRWGKEAPLVATVDQFRSFVGDAHLFGRIAANHALNDVFAMGGTPHHALALATLPHGKAEKVAEELYQLLSGVRMTLDQSDCPLVGGHSSEGEALALGLSLAGRLHGRALTKRGCKLGDRLILSKALGSGITFAADMRASARAATVDAMLQEMLLSNRAAAQILIAHGARAMTDVSGFGLIGHLGEMLNAAQGATISLDALPLVIGVEALALKGFASSLLPENRRLIRHVANPSTISAAWLAILFDPQTAGGLLAAVPPDKADKALQALQAAGYAMASDIGSISAGSGILVQ